MPFGSPLRRIAPEARRPVGCGQLRPRGGGTARFGVTAACVLHTVLRGRWSIRRPYQKGYKYAIGVIRLLVATLHICLLALWRTTHKIVFKRSATQLRSRPIAAAGTHLRRITFYHARCRGTGYAARVGSGLRLRATRVKKRRLAVKRRQHELEKGLGLGGGRFGCV